MAPTISIITIVYNGEADLPGTIASIAAQTYNHIEYIVIDGASTDRTVEVIEAHAAHIDRWVSEPDRGLYDAMNKGLAMATGDFVWFMNCGDHIYAPDTASRLAAHLLPDADIIYGETMLVDEQRRELGTRSALTVHQLPRKLTKASFKYGMTICHQAMLVRRSITAPYRLGNLAADIDWLLHSLRKARRTVGVDFLVASYLIGGVSKQRHRQGLRDRYVVLKEHYGVLPNLWHHGHIVLRGLWARWSGRAKY